MIAAGKRRTRKSPFRILVAPCAVRSSVLNAASIPMASPMIRIGPTLLLAPS
jgi:hypothetical protein